MRNFLKFKAPVLFTLLGAAGAAYGAQPPDSVQSDDSANTAMGTGALTDLTSGGSNTAGGYNAQVLNSSGYTNTAFGAYTLFLNSQGNSNTAVGYSALYSNTASDNTAMGYYALESTTTGAENTAIGPPLEPMHLFQTPTVTTTPPPAHLLSS